MAPLLGRVFPDFRAFLLSCAIILPSFLVIQYALRLIYRKLRQIQRLPSGPWGLPFVGYRPFLRKDYHIQFMELSEKYGEVFSLKLGGNLFVVLNDWDSIQEAVSREELLGRPEDPFHSGSSSQKSFPEMSGYAWREQRKIAKHLGNEGLYETSVIQEEMSYFIEGLNNPSESRFDIVKILDSSILNFMCISLFGHRLASNDPNKIDLEAALEELTENFHLHGIKATLGRLFSLLRCETYPDISECIHRINDYCNKEIDLHQESMNNGEQGNDNSNIGSDYIHRYLNAMNNRLETNRALDHLTVDTLRRNLLTLLVTGNSTMRSMMSWLLIYLVKYPDYQEKLRLEIHRNIRAQSRKPSYGDRFALPLTLAFIYEVQRLRPVLPTGISRKALQDVDIGTESIPRGCSVIFNFYAVHRDERLWEKPNEFRPERFLTDSGFKVTKPSYLIPFSSGKRDCPGKGLVSFEIFLYITTILQQYRIKVDQDETVSLEEVSLGILKPKTIPKFVFETIE